MKHWWHNLIWQLAKSTPQYAEIEAQKGRDVTWSASVSRWHAALMRDVEAQQRANRIKRRKLRGLRLERSRLRALDTLNTVHCSFLAELERRHPELQPLIDEHHQHRLFAIDGGKHPLSNETPSSSASTDHSHSPVQS